MKETYFNLSLLITYITVRNSLISKTFDLRRLVSDFLHFIRQHFWRCYLKSSSNKVKRIHKSFLRNKSLTFLIEFHRNTQKSGN